MPESSRSPFLLFTFALSLAAFGFAIAHWLDSDAAGARTLPALSDPEIVSRLTRLEERQAELRRSLEAIEQLSSLPAFREPQAVARDEVVQPEGLGSGEGTVLAQDLASRLDELETALEPLMGQLRERAERERERQLELPALVRTVCDRSLDPRSRLEALSGLRGRRNLDGSDARTQEVITAMIELSRESDNETVRADIFRQLDGVTDPLLRQPLLDALSDASARVRSEAAETLALYREDPAVRAALERVRDHDPNGEVREEAASSLVERER